MRQAVVIRTFSKSILIIEEAIIISDVPTEREIERLFEPTELI